ncbi:hypothetical protein D9M72_583390 [compost metagenome]
MGHPVLHGVSEERAAQELPPEPGVGPHSFLQSCDDDDRPFTSGGTRRGHEFHGVLQLRARRQGVHGQLLAEQVLKELVRA